MEKIDIFKEVISTESKCGQVRFVAVDGRAGSGKTTAAEFFAKMFDAEIIHTDDFASWENPIDWWRKVIEEVFEPIKNGAESISYDRTQWWENHPRTRIGNQKITPVMIIEGVSSSRKEFKQYISYSIFMKAPDELRMKRGVERDLKLGIRESENEVASYWKVWDLDEEKFFKENELDKDANVILDGTQPLENQVKLH